MSFKTTHNVKGFLEELTRLSREYNIAIGGCGCCGSPFLYGDGDGAEDFQTQTYLVQDHTETDDGVDRLIFCTEAEARDYNK